MPSEKSKAYDVEKIVSSKSDSKGRTLYLIKWKGFATSENTWEPEDNMGNCQETIEAFEAEQLKKEQSRDSNSLERRTSQRPTRSGTSPSKSLSSRTTRSSNRISSTRQKGKLESTSNRNSTSDEDEKGYIEKKSSNKRSRKSTADTEMTPSTDSDENSVLDMAKLDQILDVRRNKASDVVEYHIQVKKMKKPVWISSNRLTEDYSQQVVDFLEEKYI